MFNIIEKIAGELSVESQKVAAAVGLLDEGSTVPFIARYRKEATGGLSDTQLRELHDRLGYLRELEERKKSILESIESQGKLTPELKNKILLEDSKTKLEDLYLPYKPKRRTKAQIAREAGLEALSQMLLKDPALDPEACSLNFLNEEKGIRNASEALQGARDILIEQFSEDAELVSRLREKLQDTAAIVSSVVKSKEKEEEALKFETYFNYREPWKQIPSHRALAIFRGRKEGFLRVSLDYALASEDPAFASARYAHSVAFHFKIEDKGRPGDKWLLETARQAWEGKILLHIETQLFVSLREKAEEEAIRVFATNLKNLLLASPAGPRTTLGVDPGFRTGVKLAVVDHTGNVLQTGAIYPHAPQNRWEESVQIVSALIRKHQIELVSIGNGTASRESERLISEVQKQCPDFKFNKIVVSEAGASVYSASELASKELPDMDVSMRGAVSIARRLQDPLAELVKIDPKSIGVGQYQHDVNQSRLGKMLQAVVEDCVNAVGVDVNTASPALLAYISGLSSRMAENIIEHRTKTGGFKSRSEIKSVPGIGPKAFEQAAGFLRIMNGTNPLDASAVHPESYVLIEKVIEKSKIPLKEMLGNKNFLDRLKPEDYVCESFGLPTIRDIFSELEKPGRDPRPEFKYAEFKEGVETIKDLKPGMLLEGVITNVTNFGAFVDIGVHRDGLVHISAFSNSYVKDPHDVVKTGQVVKVRVVEADAAKGRINLSMKLNEKAAAQPEREKKKISFADSGNPFAALRALKL